MHIVPESAIAGLIDRDDCFAAITQVFAAMSRKTARNFPVIREAIGHADALFGFKSGFDREALTLGLKAGGYWPGNAANGLTNHQSTIFLFDADTGKCRAMVGGNLLTALRTAAAAAVSAAVLARPDARVLGIIGAGHQAAFQLRAVAEQRGFERVVGWNRSPDKLSGLARAAEEIGLPFESVDLDQLGALSDVIVTITSSPKPILLSAQVKPGTHLACMGTDTKGKIEVEPALVARASRFTDEISQAVSIGECQHAVALGLIGGGDLAELGAVINGDHPGRISAEEVTLFDGTGVGLQDLAVASAVVDLAITRGVAVEMAF